jgi:uncharacterized protein YciI
MTRSDRPRWKGFRIVPYLIETFDKPNHTHVRSHVRPRHLEFLDANRDKLLACGAKLNDGGEIANGGIYLLDVDDRDTAEQFISHDPFTQADLFERVVITRWRKAYFNFESCLIDETDQQDGRK